MTTPLPAPITKFSKMSEISIPECMFHPYELDDESLNLMYSDIGGIIPSQVIMLTGIPGSGKTTLAAYTGSLVSQFLANSTPYVGRRHGPVFFISREMSDFQIKLLSKKVGDFDEMVLLKDDEPGFYQNWLKDIFPHNPSLIILDSIQKLAYEMGGSINSNQINIVRVFKNYAKKSNTPIILIGHCTKEGKYIGPSYLQHEVDTHMHITVDKTNDNRSIKNIKNRFGSVAKEVIMRFTEAGIVLEGDVLNIDTDTQITTPEEFHTLNQKNKRITPRSMQGLFKTMFSDLKIKYNDRIKRANKIPNNLSLVFDQRKNIKSETIKNTLWVGLGVVKDFTIETNGYPDTEYQYINQICKTKEDKLIWMFLREFVRLFEESTPNSIEFIQEVWKIAKENRHLFSESYQ